jgi:hypothetical protein
MIWRPGEIELLKWAKPNKQPSILTGGYLFFRRNTTGDNP